jgi:hypothetical protein
VANSNHASRVLDLIMSISCLVAVVVIGVFMVCDICSLIAVPPPPYVRYVLGAVMGVCGTVPFVRLGDSWGC